MQQYLRLRKAAVQGYISTATHRSAVTPIFFPSLLLRLRPRSLQCSSELFQGQDDQEYWTKFSLSSDWGSTDTEWARINITCKISDEHCNLRGTVAAEILQPRYPHSCLDSGTLVVALLRKMILILFSCFPRRLKSDSKFGVRSQGIQGLSIVSWRSEAAGTLQIQPKHWLWECSSTCWTWRLSMWFLLILQLRLQAACLFASICWSVAY